MKKGLKKIIFERLEKGLPVDDQSIADDYGKEPDWRMVEIYKKQFNN